MDKKERSLYWQEQTLVRSDTGRIVGKVCCDFNEGTYFAFSSYFPREPLHRIGEYIDLDSAKGAVERTVERCIVDYED